MLTTHAIEKKNAASYHIVRRTFLASGKCLKRTVRTAPTWERALVAYRRLEGQKNV